MKKFLIMAALLVLVATPALAFTTVVNSKHDMVASGFAVAETGGNTEVCIFCHTPHGAQTISGAAVPLWNNTADGTKDVTAYYINTSGTIRNLSSTIDFDTADLTTINATDARLCLACHDDGVGMPINQPNTGDMIPAAAMGASALLGRDLSNDHPIGMNLGLTPEATDPYIRSLDEIRGTTFGFGEDPFVGDLGDDTINVMYCSTCHDVHDSTAINTPFLRKSNVGSALCKACHKK